MELRLGPIADIPAAAWNAHVPGGNPFLSHQFLAVLERHGATRAEDGWQPLHPCLQTGETVTAVAPAYLKGHSHGEFVYDWNWAAAYEQAGGRYYPRLYIGPPFTPMLGPKLLGPQADKLAAMLPDLIAQLELSSIHLNGVADVNRDALADAGFLFRPMWQYHWHNRRYESFDEFLGALKRRKRKNIRRERNQLREAGWRFRRVPGDQATDDDWRQMGRFYHKTFMEKGNWPNLDGEIFRELGQELGERMLIVLAERDGSTRAGALFFTSDTTLYGRYWGSLEDVPLLHFEVCYYQGIEYAIAHGLDRFEPGVFGRHKLARGFAPVEVMSGHYLRDAGFRRAVGDWLDADRPRHLAEGDALQEQSAYPS